MFTTDKKILDGAVTTNKIADNAVTTAKINNLAVTTAKLAEGAVIDSKVSLSTDAIKGGTFGDERVAISTAAFC